MNNKWLKRGTALVVLLFFIFFHFPVIQIETEDQTYYLRSQSFTLSWIHSVEHEPWYEKYERHNNKLLLTETYFKTFGAGVPSDGEIIESKDGYVHLKVKRTMEQVNLIVSDNVQTTIETKTKDIQLYELVEPYSEVEIKAYNVYLWNIWGGKFL
ncbi:DUF1850 domain-containing protein [Piscibacillus sp. B03]|uniref:DUF1850 domain-containing protein n=1 Tax=Piscibacillus sp. B03 TaxID=3457430 RepID=UPI003FCD1038